MNKLRLNMLADHLERLDEKFWCYDDIVKEVNVCGTVGCALGHCPELWPDDWTIGPDKFGGYDVEYRRGDCFSGAAEFFDIDQEEADDLFVFAQDSSKAGVVATIRRLCDSTT